MRKLAVLSITAAVALILGCSKAKVDEYAIITFMIGEVTKNSASAEIGDIIKEKDLIQTGAGSFCDIKIGGSIIRIKEKSKLVVSSLLRKGELESTELGMDVGKMMCKPKKLLKSENFTIKTPTAVAGVRGTSFTVEADAAKTTRIKVFDGSVKVVKRVKQLETSTEKILEAATAVSKEEKVVITQKEVAKAENAVEKILAKETAKGKEAEAISAVIEKSKNEISVKDIQKFAAEDFTKDNKEIIEVKEKPREVIVRISDFIKKEKESPKPDGRLLVTRYEIYFIKNGKVEWEGKVVSEPVKAGEKIYIASNDYVYCASVDGQVYWRKKLDNDGKLEIVDKKVKINSAGKELKLDLETGQQL